MVWKGFPAFPAHLRSELGTSLETLSRARASSCHEVGTTWFFSSCVEIKPVTYINNLRYADDTTLMAESEERTNSLCTLFPMKQQLVRAQLEKNHVVPTSCQDEALARHGVSRDAAAAKSLQSCPTLCDSIEGGRAGHQPTATWWVTHCLAAGRRS